MQIDDWGEDDGGGGTHRPDVYGKCWVRQWYLCTQIMFSRFGTPVWDERRDIFYGSEIHIQLTEHVRRLNLRHLTLIDKENCPFHNGCELNE